MRTGHHKASSPADRASRGCPPVDWASRGGLRHSVADPHAHLLHVHLAPPPHSPPQFSPPLQPPSLTYVQELCLVELLALLQPPGTQVPAGQLHGTHVHQAGGGQLTLGEGGSREETEGFDYVVV